MNHHRHFTPEQQSTIDNVMQLREDYTRKNHPNARRSDQPHELGTYRLGACLGLAYLAIVAAAAILSLLHGSNHR